MNKLYFSSDWHLMQKNIVKNLSRWNHADKERLRDFKDEIEMTNYIIQRTNDIVKKNDTLYLLGDLYFGKDLNELLNLLSKIKCKNIHYVFGNHDHIIHKNFNIFQNIFKSMTGAKTIHYKYPLPGTDPNRDAWKGKEIINLCHYAQRIWDQSHRGAWMLYGHSHSSLDIFTHSSKIANTINKFYAEKKTIDVGIDNAKLVLGDYIPFEFFQLKEIMDKRDILFIDQHEKRA